MAYKPRRRDSWVRLTSKDTLKALIKQRRLSYGQIGDMVDCHRSMISALVNGHRRSCTEDLARRIALVLDVPLEVLFFDPSTSAVGGNNDTLLRRPA